MKILNDTKLFVTKWISLWERTYRFNEKESQYIVASRNAENLSVYPPIKSSAVIIVATYNNPIEPHLILTSEFRVPVGGRELSFPAGLIDEKDFDGENSVKAAALNAAKRELFEETGLVLNEVIDVSEILFSSAGLTDESVVIVTCKAHGSFCGDKQEKNEDIEFRPLKQSEVQLLLKGKLNSCPEPVSKVCYPYLKMFAKYGEIF